MESLSHYNFHGDDAKYATDLPPNPVHEFLSQKRKEAEWLQRNADRLEVEDLTEEQKSALCIAANVPMSWKTEESDGCYRLKGTTDIKVGIFKEEGQFRILMAKPVKPYDHYL